MCPPVIYCGEALTKPFVYASYYSILLWSHQEIEILEMTCCTQNLIRQICVRLHYVHILKSRYKPMLSVPKLQFI